ncbi:hypothetical protein FQZ97_774450 [compost metagenome]
MPFTKLTCTCDAHSTQKLARREGILSEVDIGFGSCVRNERWMFTTEIDAFGPFRRQPFVIGMIDPHCPELSGGIVPQFDPQLQAKGELLPRRLCEDHPARVLEVVPGNKL